MIDMEKLNTNVKRPNDMPDLNNNIFPRVHNILDVHLTWISGLEAQWDTLPVSADTYSSIFCLHPSICEMLDIVCRSRISVIAVMQQT
jgi:hypothetical protein